MIWLNLSTEINQMDLKICLYKDNNQKVKKKNGSIVTSTPTGSSPKLDVEDQEKTRGRLQIPHIWTAVVIQKLFLSAEVCRESASKNLKASTKKLKIRRNLQA